MKANIFKIIAVIFIITLTIISSRNQHPNIAKAVGVVECGPPGDGCKVKFISNGDTSIKKIKGYMERQE